MIFSSHWLIDASLSLIVIAYFRHVITHWCHYCIDTRYCFSIFILLRWSFSLPLRWLIVLHWYYIDIAIGHYAYAAASLFRCHCAGQMFLSDTPDDTPLIQLRQLTQLAFTLDIITIDTLFTLIAAGWWCFTHIELILIPLSHTFQPFIALASHCIAIITQVIVIGH